MFAGQAIPGSGWLIAQSRTTSATARSILWINVQGDFWRFVSCWHSACGVFTVFIVFHPIVKRRNGRPAFADCDLPDFNIACAGNTVGVLLAEARSQVGLDSDIVRALSRQA
ncbi:hypothetical protein KFO32_00480 [Pantoea ananatis]|nr:hypothetical protein [Pantoea ananatis]MCK0551565.1 hypothetical protein [Pantoea ananatis]